MRAAPPGTSDSVRLENESVKREHDHPIHLASTFQPRLSVVCVQMSAKLQELAEGRLNNNSRKKLLRPARDTQM